MSLQSEPSEVLWLKIHEVGLTVASIATQLGVSRQQIHNIVIGKSAISPAMALKLETLFDLKAEEWLALQAASDLAKLRNASETGFE